MAILDNNLVLSEDQSITSGGVASTNVIDLNTAGDAIGTELTFKCTAVSDFGGGTAATSATQLRVQFRTAGSVSSGALVNPTVLVERGGIQIGGSTGAAKAGDNLLTVRVPQGLQRYVDANYIVTSGSVASGSVMTYVTRDY